RAYFVNYVLGQVLTLVLSVFIVLNLSKESLRPHPALARFSQMAFSYTLAGVAGIAVVALILNPPVIARAVTADLRYFLAFESSMVFAMLLLLLALACFLLWFPVRISKNTVYYVGGFSVYFLGRWLGAIALNVSFGLRTVVSAAELALSFLGIAAMAL